MTTLTYTLSSGCLKCDGSEVVVGDILVFQLKPQPNFPAEIRATILSILGTSPSSVLVEYDESLVGGFTLEACNFLGLPACLSCCDILDERVTALENASPTNVTVAVDGNGDYVITVNGTPTVIPKNNIETTQNTNGTITVTDNATGNTWVVGCLTLRADITEDQRTVTAAGFNDATMSLKEVYVDDAIVGSLTDDGIGYLGRRTGNVFTLLGSPNADYVNGFVVTYTLK